MRVPTLFLVCALRRSQLPAVAAEFYRVLRPGGSLLCVLDLASVRQHRAAGLLHSSQTDVLSYLHALDQVGFQNVQFQYHDQGSVTFETITASVPSDEVT